MHYNADRCISFAEYMEKAKNSVKKYRSRGYAAAKWFWFMPFTMVAMTVATVLYTPGNPILERVNQLLTSRLKFGKQGLTQYGFSLFGQQVDMVGNGGTTVHLKDYFFVDCSYLYIFCDMASCFTDCAGGVYVMLQEVPE